MSPSGVVPEFGSIAVLGGGEARGVVGKLRHVVVGVGDGHTHAPHAAHRAVHGVVSTGAAVRGQGRDGRFDRLLVLVLQGRENVRDGKRGGVSVLGTQGHL